MPDRDGRRSRLTGQGSASTPADAPWNGVPAALAGATLATQSALAAIPKSLPHATIRTAMPKRRAQPCTNSGGADGGVCTPGVTPAYTSCADLTTPTVSHTGQVLSRAVTFQSMERIYTLNV